MTLDRPVYGRGSEGGLELKRLPSATDQQSVISRRAFFRLSSEAAAKSCLVLTLPAILAACERAEQVRSDALALQVLTEEEFRALDAITARIIPTDETPGAREAGVAYFMDVVLADDRERELATLRAGLVDVRNRVRSAHGAESFAELSEADQDSVLRSIENEPLFGMLRYLTIAGMFALPEYGGSGTAAGYEMIGFDSRHAWLPPFGAYDVDANGGEQ